MEHIIILAALLVAILILTLGWKGASEVASAPLPETDSSLDSFYFSLAEGWSRPIGEMTDNPKRLDPGHPMFSVVVYVNDMRMDIVGLVEELSAQRCSHPYELILVCDASAEETAAQADRLGKRPGVKMTFIPPQSRSLSRRRLAYMVGIKGASADGVLLTDSTMNPPSLHWFELMAASFFEEGENPSLVLGLVRPNMEKMKGGGRWLREFRMVMERSRALGAALNGSPYRADWANLGLSRKAFFKNKGYHSSLYNNNGTDDPFIEEMAALGRVETVVAPQAMPEPRWRRYDPRPPYLLGLWGGIGEWLVLLLLATASILPIFNGELIPALPWAPFNFIPLAISLPLWICFQLLQIRIYRRASLRLMVPRLWWSLPIFLLFLPFIFADRSDDQQR